MAWSTGHFLLFGLFAFVLACDVVHSYTTCYQNLATWTCPGPGDPADYTTCCDRSSSRTGCCPTRYDPRTGGKLCPSDFPRNMRCPRPGIDDWDETECCKVQVGDHVNYMCCENNVSINIPTWAIVLIVVGIVIFIASVIVCILCCCGCIACCT